MNTRYIHIWFVLLPCVISLLLAGCGLISPTPKPPYTHYTPSKASNILLEFDYPSSWIFREDTQNLYFMSIVLKDPRFLALPTRAPNESHGTPSDFGSVDIWIEHGKPNQTLDTQFDSYKQGHSDTSWITPLNEYKAKVDGHDVNVLEYQIKPNASIDGNGYTSLMFERSVFFAVKDQMYQITFLVAEKERGGEFEQGYDYFFNSLKIVP
jgi:hypothetical protein